MDTQFLSELFHFAFSSLLWHGKVVAQSLGTLLLHGRPTRDSCLLALEQLGSHHCGHLQLTSGGKIFFSVTFCL